MDEARTDSLHIATALKSHRTTIVLDYMLRQEDEKRQHIISTASLTAVANMRVACSDVRI